MAKTWGNLLFLFLFFLKKLVIVLGCVYKFKNSFLVGEYLKNMLYAAVELHECR